MSCSDADAQKYSWRSRSSCPALWESAGYSTRDNASARLLSSSAPTWSPALKRSSSIGSTGTADQSRRVLTRWARHPTTGVS